MEKARVVVVVVVRGEVVCRKGNGVLCMLDCDNRGFEWWEDRLRNVGHWGSRLDKGLLSNQGQQGTSQTGRSQMRIKSGV